MKVVSILLILFMAGCTKPETNFVSSAVIEPPAPQEIITKPVKFKVINNQTIASIDISSTSWYALDSDNYENLAYNMQEILRFQRQQRAIIDYYKAVTNTGNTD